MSKAYVMDFQDRMLALSDFIASVGTLGIDVEAARNMEAGRVNGLSFLNMSHLAIHPFVVIAKTDNENKLLDFGGICKIFGGEEVS